MLITIESQLKKVCGVINGRRWRKQQHKDSRHKEKLELVTDDAGKSDLNTVQAVANAFATIKNCEERGKRVSLY
jgi:hypothetical protein